ncbi:MAG: hypothetical protein E7328_03910 [Clostridiales bacterium]|nr:hypothetical protein [Clostridiales bacterium]
MTKMIIAIVQDEDSRRVIAKLMEADYRVTRLATTGGFLRVGNSTLIIGVEEEQLEDALAIIKSECVSRKQFMALPGTGPENMGLPLPVEVKVGGATVFVIDVDQFIHM